MPFVVSTDWIFPTVFHHINPIPYAQVQKRKFQCDFYEVPFVRYRPNGFPKKRFDIDDPDVKVRAGTLKVDFSTKLMKRGSFKTAHPGEIHFQGGTNPYADEAVCVKQIYETKEDKPAIIRLKGRHELEKLSAECNCLRWALILLDLTYQFVDREVKKKGNPPLPIPRLRFPRSMIAIVVESSKEKVFLVEEWLDLSKHPFEKYLGNRLPESSLSDDATTEAHKITEFLLFAQHVQWQKTSRLVYTSDYQGAGDVLTDPQITSDPCIMLYFLKTSY